MTVTQAKIFLNGSENWIFGSTFNGYSAKNANNEMIFAENQISICNMAVGALLNMTDGFSIRIVYGAIRFQGFANAYKTVDDFKAFLQTQNEETVAELVSPITLQLTPQQITALSGTNTLFADAVNITVTGASDPIATITALQDRVSALESAALN